MVLLVPTRVRPAHRLCVPRLLHPLALAARGGESSGSSHHMRLCPACWRLRRGVKQAARYHVRWRRRGARRPQRTEQEGLGPCSQAAEPVHGQRRRQWTLFCMAPPCVHATAPGRVDIMVTWRAPGTAHPSPAACGDGALGCGQCVLAHTMGSSSAQPRSAVPASTGATRRRPDTVSVLEGCRDELRRRRP